MVGASPPRGRLRTTVGVGGRAKGSTWVCYLRPNNFWETVFYSSAHFYFLSLSSPFCPLLIPQSFSPTFELFAGRICWLAFVMFWPLKNIHCAWSKWDSISQWPNCVSEAEGNRSYLSLTQLDREPGMWPKLMWEDGSGVQTQTAEKSEGTVQTGHVFLSTRI